MNHIPKGSSSVDGDFSTTLTPEMRDWLSVNIENFEKILLHGLMHDPKLREIIMRVGLTHADFSNDEGRLLMGAFSTAAMMENVYGVEIPVPANSVFLKPNVEAAVFDQELGDTEKHAAMILIDDLNQQDYSSMHGIILPCLSAWFGAKRAKSSAKKIMMHKLPDVPAILDKLQSDLDSASGLSFCLENCKFDYNQPPKPPESILRLADKTIGTPGNLVTIQGPPKSAKSAVVDAIMAAAMKDPESNCDTLGFSVANPDGRAVLGYDTEQSEHDHDRLLRRSYRRAERHVEAAWLHSYLLTGKDPIDCWRLLTLTVKSAVKNHGGVMMILIDGIADFCKDPNDAGECFELVRKLHKLAVDHKCVILTVIHENPGNGGGKTRGHLGSQLERKAETSLRLQKNTQTGLFEMWVERGRSCFLPKSAGVRFEWCPESTMHVTLHTSEISIGSKLNKLDRYASEIEKVFIDDQVLTYSEFVAKIMTTAGLAKSTAKARIHEYLIHGLVQKSEAGTYQLPATNPTS